MPFRHLSILRLRHDTVPGELLHYKLDCGNAFVVDQANFGAFKDVVFGVTAELQLPTPNTKDPNSTRRR